MSPVFANMLKSRSSDVWDKSEAHSSWTHWNITESPLTSAILHGHSIDLGKSEMCPEGPC